MRLFALNLAFYQSGVEILHGLSLTCGITSKPKILTSFLTFQKVPPLAYSQAYAIPNDSKVVFSHVTAYKALGNNKFFFFFLRDRFPSPMEI